MMADLHRDTTLYRGEKFLNGKWILNVYIIKSNPMEIICDSEIDAIIEGHLFELEKNCISTEFEYYRMGLAFLHYGNRGVDLTIWHFGRWGNTFETFVCSWYCYNRETWNMTQLDSAEPILCQYEMELLIVELSSITSIIDCMSAEDARVRFLNCNMSKDPLSYQIMA